MIDVILRTATRALIPLMVAFSLFLLVRGHNEPGGGFLAGLVVAAALALYGIAYDVASARRALRVDPRALIGMGVAIAIASGLIALAGGEPPLTGQWTKLSLPGVSVDLGTPLLFDVGVYLTVSGATLTIVFALEEE
jgi:multicomponent Na+:H+ antiporter subunit B